MAGILGQNTKSKVIKKASTVTNAMRGNAVFVSNTEPVNPQLNDIWIKI